MAPPKLARNAPRLNIAHPGEEGVLPLPRHEHGLAGLHRLDRRLGQGAGVAIPLGGQQRLDRDAATVAMRYLIDVRLNPVEQFQAF